MLVNLKNFAYRILEKIPIVRNFIGKNKSEINNQKKIIHDIPLVEENKKNQFGSINIKNISTKIKNLLKLDQRNFTINKFPEFKNELLQCFIKKSYEKPLEFDNQIILNLLETHQKILINNFKNKIQEINNSNNNNLDNYINLWSTFINASKNYIEEVQTEIIFNITNNEYSDDMDLMACLKLNQELSKKISENTLQVLASELNNISIKNHEKQEIQEKFKNIFGNEYRNLFIGSQFGKQSKKIIELIQKNIESDKSKEGKEFFYNLVIKSKFQNAVIGSLYFDLDIKENSNNSNETNPEIGTLESINIKNVFERLSDRYIDYVNLRNKFIRKPEYDAKKNKITDEINEIKEYLYQSGLTENTLSFEVKNLKSNEYLEKLGLDGNKFINEIKNIYDKNIWMSNYLGTIQKELVNGNEFENKPIIELFNKKNDERIDQLKRIFLEINCLACIEVILKNLQLINENVDFTKIKKNNYDQVLPATENFKSIPWLKNYYQQKVEYYKEKINNANSNFKIGSVIYEISKIGKELHRTKFFSSSDFFLRYGLEREGELLNSLIGKMTNVGRMSLNLEFVSHFLASIDPEENQDIDPNLISNIDSLINYLAKISTIYNSSGKEVFSPNKTEDYIEKAYLKLKNTLGNKDFLAFNTPLIVDFLKKTFGKDLPDEKPIPKDSFYSKNQVLSTWLFYILVKFLPEQSNDQESLKARILIFNQILDDNFQNKARLTSELYKKIIRKGRGLDDNDKPSQTSNGVIKALCLDFERHIQNHIQSKDSQQINLMFLLNEYSNLEDTIKKNPKSVSKISKHQKIDVLTPLENYLFDLFKQKPLEIVKFIKEKENSKPHYKNILCTNILDDICKNIKKLNFVSNSIVIRDSDEILIKETIKILEKIISLGLILNSINQNSIRFSSEQFNTKDNDKKEMESKIEILTSFINSKVSLLIDEKYSNEVELFKDQYEHKNRLKQLLSRKYLGFKALTPRNINWEKTSKELAA